MNNLEVGREALEDELVFLVVNAELFRLPVDVPGAHGAVPPRLLVLHGVEVDEDETVVGNAEQILYTTGESNPKSICQVSQHVHVCDCTCIYIPVGWILRVRIP